MTRTAETKTAPGTLEIKADVKQGIVTAYASVFGNRDSYGDRVMPGAFTKTLMESSRRVRVLRDHSPYIIVGTPQTMEQDSTGLLTVTKMSGTGMGQEMLTLLAEGAVNELSIGFNTIQSTENDLGGRDLTELKLFEYSFVVWAANDLAQVVSVKDAAELDGMLHRLDTLIRLDFKAGRTLSAANLKRVQAALKELQDLLTDAGEEGAATGTPDATTSASKGSSEPQDALVLQASLTDLKAEIQRQKIVAELRAFGRTLLTA